MNAPIEGRCMFSRGRLWVFARIGRRGIIATLNLTGEPLVPRPTIRDYRGTQWRKERLWLWAGLVTVRP